MQRNTEKVKWEAALDYDWIRSPIVNITIIFLLTYTYYHPR